MSQSSRNRAMSSGSGRSGRGPAVDEYNMATSSQLPRYFDPCAATASMFLYAQGSSIVCCHHDTLTIERRFSRHKEEVQLLAADTQSELGAGRLVVSYDAGQTAIVWDLMTGDEVARFSSYEHLTVAAWMRNGNVAFGNTQGNIILYEPTTSEHISTRTIDQIAVTALAPAADCRTFAIGYQNGSLLVATLQPRFTILHNLNSSRAPSPIVNLAWHASSSRQKSDMLAVQQHDGDLRVWSVAKSYSGDDPAKVVRILKRTDNYFAGPNWMGWSKNGRIIQYFDSETLSWDVRTKHVTYDSIPTLEHVRGLAVYGPGASLFTLGANNTVQQFDLNSPAIIVCNVQHPANLLPPSPPVSIEEQVKTATTIVTSESDGTVGALEPVSESEDDHLSPFARLTRRRDQAAADIDRYGANASPISSRSGLSSLSRSSAGSRTPSRYPQSVLSRSATENTYMSTGSSMRSHAVTRDRERERERERDHHIERERERESRERERAREREREREREQREREHQRFAYATSNASTSIASSAQSRHRPSRLRNEVMQTPDEPTKVHDLFRFTKARLADVPYRHPPKLDNTRLTNDDLRRQMLNMVFGWNKDVEDLIRDEMNRHPAGSPNRILLAKWLGDIDPDIMAASSENMTSSDWMLLALSGIGGTASQHKLGRAYIQRLLEKGDINAAATIMIGMGDKNDAIEIYVSHKKYMEAVILTCLFFPTVWERQSAIVKKWGDWAAQHGQQKLSIRCLACTDRDSSEPWFSPSAVQLSFQGVQGITSSIPEILNAPMSPPGVNRGPQRSIAKTSALKLITSFGEQGAKAKFFSAADGGQTPIAAGVTPIAESAISPHNDVTTAFLRPSNRSTFNTPNSARSNTSAFSRGRLPSIGELTPDLPRLKATKELPTPSDSDEARSRNMQQPKIASTDQDNMSAGLALQRAATASPMMMRDTYKRIAQEQQLPMPSPDALVMVKMEEKMRSKRNGSRDRIPGHLQLKVRTQEEPEVVSPDASVASSTRFHWPSRRRGPGSVAGSITSTSSAGRSMRSYASTNKTGDYIHSLDAAQQRKKPGRHSSRDDRRESSRSRPTSRDRRRLESREPSEDRGRSAARTYAKPKRSPTSPVPMSPEDLINLATPKMSEIGTSDPSTVRKTTQKAPSRNTSRGSRGSRTGRRRSPDNRPQMSIDARGRSANRQGSLVRSPSSPLPMKAEAAPFHGSDDEDYDRAVQDREKFRSRYGGNSRSTSRGPREHTAEGHSRRDRSESRRPSGSRNGSRRRRPSVSGDQDNAERELVEDNRRAVPAKQRAASTEHAGDLKAMKDERQRKKDLAARELEERRKSLAQRPQVPIIPHPNEFAPSPYARSEAGSAMSEGVRSPPSGEHRSMYARAGSNFPIGLPATPKAMRLVLDSADRKQVPEVPPIPTSFAQRATTPSPKSSPDKVPDAGLLTLLPSTVYQPPTRPMIPRSMSAPIPDDPKDVQARFSKQTRTSTRGGEMRGIDEMMGGRRASHDDQIPTPPPPPPPPPMLKELAHLALPPPPPPAPLPHAPHFQPVPGSAGNIEILMDDEEEPPIAAPIDNTVPVLAPPVPPAAKSVSGGHSRGRSIGENSISSRISKATERLRSASRNRRETRTKSPLHDVPAPYESVPPPISYNRDIVRSPPISGPGHLPTGLHESELI